LVTRSHKPGAIPFGLIDPFGVADTSTDTLADQRLAGWRGKHPSDLINSIFTQMLKSNAELSAYACGAT
jgi:hypothetical protein